MWEWGGESHDCRLVQRPILRPSFSTETKKEKRKGKKEREERKKEKKEKKEERKTIKKLKGEIGEMDEDGLIFAVTFAINLFQVFVTTITT